jgi:CubicO group peptidase (beta-lactamase class C family)
VEDESSYNGDSLTNVFSSTKNMSAIVVATLVDKGLMHYSDLVR